MIERTATHHWCLPEDPPIFSAFDGEPVWLCLFDRRICEAVSVTVRPSADTIADLLQGPLGDALYAEDARAAFHRELGALASINQWMQRRGRNWHPPTAELTGQYGPDAQDFVDAARTEFRDEPVLLAAIDGVTIPDAFDERNRVNHAEFGKGTIIERVGPGKIKIRFDSGDVRTLLEDYVLRAV